MSRSFKELVASAMHLRMRLLMEGKEPSDGIFHITSEEWSQLRMEPACSVILERTQLTDEAPRLCGLLVKRI